MTQTKRRVVPAVVTAAVACLALALSAAVATAAPAARAGSQFLTGTVVSVRHGGAGTVVGLKVRGIGSPAMRPLVGRTVRLSVTGSTRVGAIGEGRVSPTALKQGALVGVRTTGGSPAVRSAYTAATVMIMG